jgi:hypothetical protein
MYSHLFGNTRALKMKYRSSFGMDYATPGVLGGLGGGYVQPNLLYYGQGSPMNIGSGDLNAEVAALNDFGIGTKLNKKSKKSSKSKKIRTNSRR